MGIFGRRKATPAPDPELTEAAAPEPPPGEPGVDRDWERHHDGPFDVSELSDLGGRIDLGALRVPALRGMELRLDVEQGSGRVVGVTCGVAGSQVQLQAFAAPRSSGLWPDIRREIAEGVRKTGGSADMVEGLFGTELLCRLPGRSQDGRVAIQPARFIGVDGPRWLLRVVVHGPAAVDDTARGPLLSLVRQVVVDRGDEPRPPREVLALAPPKEVVEAFAKRAAARAEGQDATPTGQNATPEGGTTA